MRSNRFGNCWIKPRLSYFFKVELLRALNYWARWVLEKRKQYVPNFFEKDIEKLVFHRRCAISNVILDIANPETKPILLSPSWQPWKCTVQICCYEEHSRLTAPGAALLDPVKPHRLLPADERAWRGHSCRSIPTKHAIPLTDDFGLRKPLQPSRNFLRTALPSESLST